MFVLACLFARKCYTCLHVCACVREGGRKLTCRLITEISWTDSGADEWLAINRLLFSLNSCLSTSLIKSRRQERKSNQPMKTDFSSSPSALEMGPLTSSYTIPTRRGSSSTTHVYMLYEQGEASRRWQRRLCTLDFGLQFVNQEQQS